MDRRRRVGRGRTQLRRPWRYAVALALAGPSHAAGLCGAVMLLPWWAPTYLLTFAALFPTLTAVAWIVGWLLRCRIAVAVGWLRSIGEACLLAAVGCYATVVSFLAAGGAWVLLDGGGDRGAAFGSLVVSPFTGALFAAVVLVVLLPAALPVTWLAVLALRVAAGGVVGAPPRAHPVPRIGTSPVG